MTRAKRRVKNNKKLITNIISIAFSIWVLLQIFLPSFDVLSLYDRIPELLSGKVGLVVNGDIVSGSNPIVYENNEVLLPINIINEYIDDTILVNDNFIICANGSTYIRYEIDNNKYVLNNKIKKGTVCPIKQDNIIYVPLSLLSKLYGTTYTYHKDNLMLVMDTVDVTRYECLVLSEGEMRESPSIKSSIVGNVYTNDIAIMYEQNDTWSKIVNKDGITGYVKNTLLQNNKTLKNEPSKDIELTSGTTYGEVEVKLETTVDNDKNKKINILWYQVNNKNNNPKVNTLEKIPGMTHMCFTWFEIINKDGEIKDKVDSDIVKWAHKNNYKIWALVTNPFSDSNLTHDILSNAVSRENAIKEMISLCKKYNIDGINVDIESIAKKTGPYYVQFIRELSVFSKLNDLELSLDMYMPSQSTAHYNREVVSEYVDYFCLMAYDEHWGTCDEAGSVSSIPWVEKGIQETLKTVSKNKLVLGIPLYTRRWETGLNNYVDIHNKALGMKNAYDDLEKHKVKIKFDDVTKQNYGEYKDEETNHMMRIWLEDETSIKERLELANLYELRGVASWKKGFEKDSIWSLYEDYMKK